jgi:hypothetical protein
MNLGKLNTFPESASDDWQERWVGADDGYQN